MIPNSTRNRIITRGCIAFVATIAPFSIAFVLYVGIWHQEILQETSLLSALFALCLSESLFWIWSTVKYSRPLIFARVIPTFEERQKLKADCLQIIQLSSDGGKEFIEGWFKTNKKKSHIEDLRVDNIKDWYLPSFVGLTVGFVGRILQVRRRRLCRIGS